MDQNPILSTILVNARYEEGKFSRVTNDGYLTFGRSVVREELYRKNRFS